MGLATQDEIMNLGIVNNNEAERLTKWAFFFVMGGIIWGIYREYTK